MIIKNFRKIILLSDNLQAALLCPQHTIDVPLQAAVARQLLLAITRCYLAISDIKQFRRGVRVRCCHFLPRPAALIYAALVIVSLICALLRNQVKKIETFLVIRLQPTAAYCQRIKSEVIWL